MPKKDKMLLIRKNIALPEDEREYVWNACSRALKTEDGNFIVPIGRCFGDEEHSQCGYLCIWKSPALNSKNRSVIFCMNECPNPE